MRISEIKAYRLRIPFSMAFTHASSSYSCTDNIIVKITLRDKGEATGFGECIPRMHVTGETPGSVLESISRISGLLGSKDFTVFADVQKHLGGLGLPHTVAACAVELALLDALGKANREYIGAFIGKRKNRHVMYAGIIPHLGLEETMGMALRMKGFRNIKVKVGFDDDMERLSAVRKVLGKEAVIIVDANCAWSDDEAAEKINRMASLGIACVEQPLKKSDKGMLSLRKRVKIPLMADESLCSVEDAENLARSRLFDMWNIRISKCGGISGALRIAGIAREKNIPMQLGCHVGETGILSAAGRALALHTDFFTYAEGSYGRYLLKEDIVKDDISFGKDGLAEPIKGYGLGITVDEKILERYASR